MAYSCQVYSDRHGDSHIGCVFSSPSFLFLVTFLPRHVSNILLLKHIAERAAERFEAQTIELSNKVEDLNKHVNELAQQRQRLQAENNDLLKEVSTSILR